MANPQSNLDELMKDPKAAGLLKSFYFRLRQAYQMAQFYYGMVCPLAAGSPGMVE